MLPGRILRLAAATLITTTAFVVTSGASLPRASTPSAMQTTEQWVQDIDFLAAELPKRHINLFHQLPEARFNASIQGFKVALSTLNPDEILVGLLRIVAAVGDSHTGIGYRSRAALPLMTYWYDDGIWIQNVDSANESILFNRITAVNGRPITEVIALLGSIIPHENEAQVRNQVPGLITDPLILHGLKIIERPDAVRLTVISDGGAERTVELKPIALTSAPAWVVNTSDETKAPLYLRNRRQFYWFQILSKPKTLFFKYNSCQENSDMPFAKFIAEMFAAADSGDIERIALDLRHNGGGDSSIFQPFLDEIRKRTALNHKGRLFVLIGRRTFSSAILNAIDMKKQTAALLIGEPTGGKPNHYGEVQSFKLPNSGLTVTFSVKHFKVVDGDPDSLQPDIRVPFNFADYRAGRDPVLEKVLTFAPSGRPGQFSQR